MTPVSSNGSVQAVFSVLLESDPRPYININLDAK